MLYDFLWRFVLEQDVVKGVVVYVDSGKVLGFILPVSESGFRINMVVILILRASPPLNT